MAISRRIEPTANAIDFDLHGIVGIRLLDATPEDASAVLRQLGPIQAPLERTPDLVIRFVDPQPEPIPVRLLGLDDAGFTDDSFLILHHRQRPVRVRIPFDQIGGQCEIVCEHGLPAVPLLVPIINLAALAKGVIALHAAAFHYHGQGVLVTGWSKGGKTETLLGFLARGAEYIGDEWVYLSGEERRMFGIPEPVRVWDWHLADLPEFRALLSVSERGRLAAWRGLHKLADLAAAPGHPLSRVRVCRKARDLVKKQPYVDVDPQRLFGRRLGSMRGTVDRLLFVVSHDRPETLAAPISPVEVADRMVASLQYEEREFRGYYQMARFAFPQLSNDVIDFAEERRRELLARALEAIPAHTVFHPYPAHIPSLVQAIDPLLRRGSLAAAASTAAATAAGNGAADRNAVAAGGRRP